MKGYEWLNKVSAPKHMVEAIKLLGTSEVVGKKHNKTILNWAKECGLEKIYTADEISWCGLFVSVTIKRANREPLKGYNALRAREWAKWGMQSEKAEFGDILVFSREGGGHVGYYVAEDKDCYHVLGGNQSNTVNVTRILKSRLIAIRRPAYVNKPSEVKSIIASATGTISTNEA